MTEAEAILILGEQFQGKEGFLAQLGRGAGVDREALIRVRPALSSLREAWAGKTDAPKAALLPLVHISSRIRAGIKIIPRVEDELIRLSMDLEEEVECAVFGAYNHTDALAWRDNWSGCRS